MEKLNEITDFYEYLDALAALKDCYIFAAACDTMTPAFERTNIGERGYEKLAAIGIGQLRRDNYREQFWCGYAAVLLNGRAVYEFLAPTDSNARYDFVRDGLKVSVFSSPYRAQNRAEIKINGKDYAVNRRGLNFVIYDKKGKKVLDSVCFDTWGEDLYAIRKYEESPGETASEEGHYDVAVMGVWYGCNYGSIATYYALNTVLKNMGLSVLMIDKPVIISNDADEELGNTHSRVFAREHYNISKRYKPQELKALNANASAFMLGSDQLWNYEISKNFKKSYYLDFAAPEKKKIAYATSFGFERDFAPPDERKIISALMQRFDAISVRESHGVGICRDVYGVRAVQNVDPVFLAGREIFDELAKESHFKTDEKYIAAYILDPTPEKKKLMERFSEHTGYKLVNILDGIPWLFKKNEKRLGLKAVENARVQEWIYIIKNCEFLITDSCHGACFGILYNKRFIALANRNRGVSRFVSLADVFGVQDRVVPDEPENVDPEAFLKEMDYEKINRKLEEERKRCSSWIRDALFLKKDELPAVKLSPAGGAGAAAQAAAVSGAKASSAASAGANAQASGAASKEGAKAAASGAKPAASQTEPLSNDMKRCRLTAAMLKEYGIRHIVCSSGTRHVQLVRFFEYNSCFCVHSVVDERSAAFYALGIAAYLKEPVAVCCTSGTAASNYLSGMSEAFYQQLPLIFITADRYQHLLNQREDQMVPQDNMYGAVCKKSVTLPVVYSGYELTVTRRLLCETITEAMHGTPGPVQINVPLGISDKDRTGWPKESYDLEAYEQNPKELHAIRRYVPVRDEEGFAHAAAILKNSQRIFIAYGQKGKPSEEELASIGNFCRRYNCVIGTDNLSNLQCAKSVNMFNALQRVNSSPQLLNALKPDVVLTMNANSIADMRTFIVKSAPPRHWEVNESGSFADPFKKLEKVFECSAAQFFRIMSSLAPDEAASDSYYSAWKKQEFMLKAQPDTYCQKYAVRCVIQNMPENSLLHLANSNSVRMGCSYALKEGVEVFCNRGTNGIDGSASTFMGHAAVCEKPCYLIIGDLSFFYDMNSLWNKKLTGNIRIMLLNNHKAGLLEHHGSPTITYENNTTAKGWVESLGFSYMSAQNKEEYDSCLKRFVSAEDAAMFFEVFC